MILCLDAGNTRLKWGLRDGTRWLAHDALDYTDLDSLPARLRTHLPDAPRRVVACNVAGAEATARIEALAAQWSRPVDWLRSSAAACGVTNAYEFPERLGADRWAALIGARALTKRPCVVVMAGTATTVDVLDENGRFGGGLILPGLDLMRAALAQNTAGLPFANGRYQALPTNTDDAIVSGIVHATLGAIERMRRVAATGSAEAPAAGEVHDEGAGESKAGCLLSGGAAAQLVLHIDAPVRHIQPLVLEGLAVYAASSFS